MMHVVFEYKHSNEEESSDMVCDTIHMFRVIHML